MLADTLALDISAVFTPVAETFTFSAYVFTTFCFLLLGMLTRSSISYMDIDDVQDKAASLYCEELKRKRQIYKTKCRSQTSSMILTSPKPRLERKENLLRQKSIFLVRDPQSEITTGTAAH